MWSCPIQLVLACSQLSCAPLVKLLCKNTGLIPSLLPSVWADSISREAHFHPIFFRNYTQASVSDWSWVNTLHDLPPQAPVRVRCAGFPSPVLLLRCSVAQKGLLRPGSSPLPPSFVQRYPIKFNLITLTIYMTYFISEELKNYY